MINRAILPLIKQISCLKNNGECSDGPNKDKPLSAYVRNILHQWRDIDNLDDDNIWTERLKILGCTQDELCSLIGRIEQDELHSDSDKYVDNSPTQTLLNQLIEITDKNVNIQDLEQSYGSLEKENFGPVLYAFFIHSHQTLTDQIAGLDLSNKDKLNLDTLSLQLAHQFTNKVKQHLAPSLVTEYHCAEQAGLLPQKNTQEQFKFFACSLSNTPEWIQYYFQEYPVLLYYLSTSLKNWLRFGIALFKRLDEDLPELYTQFGLGKNITVTGISAYMGDSHHQEQTTSMISFSSGTKIFYKPRVMDIEQGFYLFIAELKKLGFTIDFCRELRMLTRSDYGWVEYVDSRPCKNQAQVRQFYINQGVNLALAYVLGIYDLWNDNIIAQGPFPCLIDLECVLNPYFPVNLKDVAGLSYGNRYLQESVLYTGLIPTWSMDDANRKGINAAGISRAQGQIMEGVLTWTKDDKGRMIQKHENLLIESEETHLPRLKDSIISVGAYPHDFIQGFRSGYLFIKEHKHELTKALSVFNKSRTRILVRHTNAYARLLRESRHPDYLQKALLVDILFENLWAGYDQSSKPAALIQSEIDQLWDGDIPYFYTYAHSRDLWDAYDNVVAKDFFEKSGVDAAKIRLDRLSDHDLALQIDFIEKSLAIFEDFNPQNTVTPVLQFCPDEIEKYDNNLPDRQFLIAEALNIGEILLNNAFKQGDDISWICPGMGRLGQWELGIKPMGLYDGTDGIALFLAYLYECTGRDKFRYAVESVVKKSLAVFDNEKDFSKLEIGRVSVFNYPCSLFFLLQHLNRLWGTSFSPYSRLDRCYQWIESQLPYDKDFDFLSGAAGAIHLLLNIYDDIHDEKALALAVQCGDHLLKNAEENNSMLSWETINFKSVGGFAHGSASFAWVLMRLGKICGQEKFARAGLKALNHDRSLFNNKLGAWQDIRFDNDDIRATKYWCNGSAGIGLSRLLISEYIDDEFLYEEMKIALNFTLEYGFDHSHCICHGHFGNLEIVYALARKLNDSHIQTNILKFLNHVIKTKEKEANWHIGIHERYVEILGLFTGLAGIGYNLLRFADWCNVPSILACESGNFQKEGNPLH